MRTPKAQDVEAFPAFLPARPAQVAGQPHGGWSTSLLEPGPASERRSPHLSFAANARCLSKLEPSTRLFELDSKSLPVIHSDSLDGAQESCQSVARWRAGCAKFRKWELSHEEWACLQPANWLLFFASAER